MSYSYLQIHNLDAGQGPEIHVDTLSVKIVLDPDGTSPAMGGSVGSAFGNQATPTLIRIRQGVDEINAVPIFETGSGLAPFPASGAWETSPISINAGLFVAGEKLFFDIHWDDNGNAGQEEGLDIYLSDNDTDNDGFATPAIIDASQSQGANANVAVGQGNDDTAVPAPYASMGALQGRMKIDTVQIKHRLHTENYPGGGYKPSQPASESAQADYKAYPADGMITNLRQAAFGTDGTDGDASLKTIPYVLSLDSIEARLASLSDADLSVAFDQPSPVWRAESDADDDGNGRVALKALGDMDVANDLDVAGRGDILGDAAVTGQLTVSDDATITGTLEVADSATIGGDLDAQAAFSVAGDAAFAGNVTMDGDLDVALNVDIQGSLTVEDALVVDGTSEFSGNVTAESDLTVDNQLDVNGSADFDVTDFNVDASGEIKLESDHNSVNPAIHIKAAAGIVKIEGTEGVEIHGPTEFKDDLLIKDSLILHGDTLEADEPDFIIKDDQGAILVNLNGSQSGMQAEITGDLTVGGNLVVVDSLEVDGQQLQATATVSTFGDNIIEINKDGDVSKKSVGIKLDGAQSERDFFFGINKDSSKFVFSKENAQPDSEDNDNKSWEDALMSEAYMSDLSQTTHVAAAELHFGSARAEGILAATGDMKIGASGSEILKVESQGTTIGGAAGAVVTVDGDAIVNESLKVDGGLLDVDGDADVLGGLIVEGIFKADDDGNGFSLVVDHSQVGLSGTEAAAVEQELDGTDSVDRLKLGTGVADVILDGDMQLDKAKLGSAVVDGRLEAYGKVGLGASDKEVRVYGELMAEMDVEMKEALRVSNDGAGNYGLVIDDAEQTAGLSIASRELAAGSDAMFTLASGKDMLLQGKLGVADDAIFSGDIWFDGKLASKSEFIMQDSFTDGDVYKDSENVDQSVYGFVLASDEMKSYNGVSRNKDVQELLLNVPSEVALVDLPTAEDGSNQKHISMMGILSSLISGGSMTRVEHAVASAGVEAGSPIDKYSRR